MISSHNFVSEMPTMSYEHINVSNSGEFREEDFLTFSYCKSTGDDDPRGVAN